MDNLQSEGIDKFLKEIGVGRRALNDKFFEETHEACKVFQRSGVTVEDDEELCHNVSVSIILRFSHISMMFRYFVTELRLTSTN